MQNDYAITPSCWLAVPSADALLQTRPLQLQRDGPAARLRLAPVEVERQWNSMIFLVAPQEVLATVVRRDPAAPIPPTLPANLPADHEANSLSLS